jgi:hypothetical protein
MRRRTFMTAGLGTATALVFNPWRAWAQLSAMDAMLSVGELRTDNDEFPHSAGGRPDFTVKGDWIQAASYNLKYYTFEIVMAHLSPFLESRFEMFFLANTDVRGSTSDFVRHQHLKVIRKKEASLPAFQRDASGRITGLSENAEVWDLIPISSGRGAPVLLTYSGIFRFNHIVSRERVGTNENTEANMSWSTYIDYVYNTGREARVAIHGTPTRNHHLLGVSRASEGCLRVLPKAARKIRDLLLSPQMWASDLPEFDRRAQLPSAVLRDGNVAERAGIKALALFFNGYSQVTQDT